MRKVKPIVAKTPEELAGTLGLSAAAAKEWQVQYALLKRLKEIARREEITHAEIARRAGTSRTRVTAILNDDLEHVSSDLLIRILASLCYRVRVSVVRSDSAALGVGEERRLRWAVDIAGGKPMARRCRPRRSVSTNPVSQPQSLPSVNVPHARL